MIIISYGIIRIQKFSSGSVKGIEIHDKRSKGLSHTNSDIDFSRSELNYDLVGRDESYHSLIKNRINELNLKKAVRKDAVVMCQALITSDYEFFQNLSIVEQRKFFEDGLSFIKKRYGEENIISATVHLDEKTPHLHVNFVPITNDGRLSAKSVLPRKEFTLLHDDFYKQVGKSYGLERGVTKQEKAEHLSVQDYKRKTLETEVESLTKKLDGLLQKIEYYSTNDVKLDTKESKLNKNNVIISKENLKEIEDVFTLCKVQQGKIDNLIQEKNKLNGNSKRVNKAYVELQNKFDNLDKFRKMTNLFIAKKDLRDEHGEFLKNNLELVKEKAGHKEIEPKAKTIKREEVSR